MIANGVIEITQMTYTPGHTLRYECLDNFISFEPVETVCESPSFTWSLDASPPSCTLCEYTQ